MANILDYIDWRGDLSFRKSPFGPVDNVILSQVVYGEFDGVIPGPDGGDISFEELAQRLFEEKTLEEWVEEPGTNNYAPQVLYRMWHSKRYGKLRVRRFVNRVDKELETQFSAFTVEIDQNTDVIVFRGTDNTVVGWKENFNMNYSSEIPAQRLAVKYIKEVAAQSDKNLYICGHSKGGNLAMYAAVNSTSDIIERIQHIYSNDGPGFKHDFFEKTKFKTLMDRITVLIPNTSIIGLFFDRVDSCCRIVQAEGKVPSTHCMMTWQVLGADFVGADEIDPVSLEMRRAFANVTANISASEMEEAVNAMFGIVWELGVTTTEDISKGKLKNLREFIAYYSKLDTEKKEVLKACVKAFGGTEDHLFRDYVVNKFR